VSTDFSAVKPRSCRPGMPRRQTPNVVVVSCTRVSTDTSATTPPLPSCHTHRPTPKHRHQHHQRVIDFSATTPPPTFWHTASTDGKHRRQFHRRLDRLFRCETAAAVLVCRAERLQTSSSVPPACRPTLPPRHRRCRHGIPHRQTSNIGISSTSILPRLLCHDTAADVLAYRADRRQTSPTVPSACRPTFPL